jgi:hypothetical protein
MRKYGVGEVTEVEPTGEAITKEAAKDWTEDDEEALRQENEDADGPPQG